MRRKKEEMMDRDLMEALTTDISAAARSRDESRGSGTIVSKRQRRSE